MKKLILIFLFCISLSTKATPIDRLSKAIETEIFNMSHSLGETQFFEKRNSQGSFNFTGFEINLQTPFGFELPHLINIEIVPELEMVWEKVEE